MEMNYCMQCGSRLQMKEHPEGGFIPYCSSCAAFRHPVFNTAVSMIVMNPEKTKVILIRQYGRPFYVLVAGYVNQGEDAENAAVREVREEIGLDVKSVHFNRSHYFAPSNTLMLNFTVTVEYQEAHPNYEVDSWKWFSVEDAQKQIKPASLAQAFLNGFLNGEYTFS